MEPTTEQLVALNRAEQAERIMGDPMVMQALAALEVAVTDQWKDGALGSEQREELHRIYQAQLRFIKFFEEHLQTGQFVAETLGVRQPKQSFLDRLKEFIHGNKAA